MFTNYYPIPPKIVPPRVLTSLEKMLLTDLYAEGLSADKARRKSNIPRGLVNFSYAKKKAIENKVIEIMRGQLVKEVKLATRVIEGMETEEKKTVYHDVPESKTILTNLAYTFFPDCDKEPFKYNIEAIISWCDGTGEATWREFYNAFKVKDNDGI